MQVDYLIVGQGLAGTLLGHFLEAAGQSVYFINQPNPRAASRVAAGIINPITGRYFVKSWLVDELIPFARQSYQALEARFNCRFFFERNILRSLNNEREETDWLARLQEPGYAPYMIEVPSIEAYAQYAHPIYAHGEVTQSAQVQLDTLLDLYRRYLLQQDRLLEAPFHHTALQLLPNGIAYEGIQARKVIFCEGFQATQNPYFNHLPFEGAKGEVLLVDIPNAHFEKLLKRKIFIVPLSSGHYWIGSNYARQFPNDLPTPQGRLQLIDELQQILHTPFEILEHQAAIRPTVKDRRPLIGLHPEHPQLGIFNGLGTKGASLGPYFARQFAAFLTAGGSLNEKVRLGR